MSGRRSAAAAPGGTHAASDGAPAQPEIQRIVDAARGVWIRGLIDYSRSNALLFYRELKVGTLDLSQELRAVERLLAGERLGPDALVTSIRHGDSNDPVIRERARAEARQKARSSLVALHRKALGNLEEKGIETLHLAVGFATWPASDGGRPYDAPVLLLSARIEARGGRSGEDMRVVLAGEPHSDPPGTASAAAASSQRATSAGRLARTLMVGE